MSTRAYPSPSTSNAVLWLRTPLVAFAMLLCAQVIAAPTADSENSGLTLTASDEVPDAFELSWWAKSAHFYFVEQTEDLHHWTLLPIFEVGADGVLSWGFSSTAPRLFLRLRYTNDPEAAIMQADHDGDGLTTYQEYLLGSDPFNPDTSGDGIWDGIAHKLGLAVTPPAPPQPDPGDETPPAITLHLPTSAVLVP